MTNAAWTPQEETLLAQYLVERVCSRALGRNEDECLRNAPRDVYFIGNLRPRPVDDDLGELINKLAPMAFGAEFRFEPKSDEVTIKVKVQWSCYYRVFPTYSQQRKHQQQIAESENDAGSSEVSATASTISSQADAQRPSNSQEEPDDADHTLEVEQEQEEQRAEVESPEVVESSRDRRRGRVSQDSLAIRYRKIICAAAGEIVLRRDAAGDWSRDVSNLQAVLDQETARAQQVALGDPNRVRTAGAPDDKIRVREDALASEADYEAFLRSLQTDVVPAWQWEITSEVRPNNELGSTDQVVAIEFVNASPQADNPNIEAFLFDTQATFIFINATVQPFELELAPRGFRYNRDLWGRGFNCAVDREQADVFTTTHTPIYTQMRYATQTNPPARFADLAGDRSEILQVLRAIVTEMENYQQNWKQERQNYIANDPNWQTEFGNEFDRDFQQYKDEIRRFRRGCELIRTNQDVELAFRLTNETFRRLGDHPRPGKRKESWRLFQIVFLVSQIPGIAALADPNSPDVAEREMVDIIYFPTGGGKTEAYLGTIVFHCFFDRLRGKTAGVTAWTRFPLRLLTLQQTQRMADVIGVADLVRREQQDLRLSGRDVDKFAVGYFVGAEATPNEIVNPDRLHPSANKAKPSSIWSQANDTDIRQRWKRVISCPSCRTSTVQVDFDSNATRIIHRCTQPSCSFPNGEIPIYVIDNEIYRYLPCVVVGTIDKLASLGNQRKLSQVFGQVDGRCTLHGYYKGKCCQKDCSGEQLLRPGRPRGLSGPTLFVQDELHLLKEGLGTFDGHYETFTQQLQREFDPSAPTLKVIASSATIEAFERQVEHLYGRRDQARIFPGLGPNLQESFYAQTRDYPSRLFVGILPHNKTIFNTILELIEFYHRETHHLKNLPAGQPNPYGGVLSPGSPEWHRLMDFYITSLTYFLANRELDSIRVDLDGDVNPNLSPALELEISQLTGGTSTDEVTRILEKLERSASSSSTADTVLATSMISHGVDVDRFNGMIFYGMPRQNAEYIQASSRVGRSHVGIVFNCLHPARERDQSHYTYFVKFHEFLGQLVEPVAINRWAKFSVNRTLPGLFMGVLLQLIANRSGANNPNSYYMLDFVKQEITRGNLDINQFIPILERAYLVQAVGSVSEQAFQDQIRIQVQQFLDQIISAGSGEKFISGVLIPQPMTSLRDVDEPIPIELDSSGTQWAARS